jgi:hypothetical protein
VLLRGKAGIYLTGSCATFEKRRNGRHHGLLND